MPACSSKYSLPVRSKEVNFGSISPKQRQSNDRPQPNPNGREQLNASYESRNQQGRPSKVMNHYSHHASVSNEGSKEQRESQFMKRRGNQENISFENVNLGQNYN